MKMYCRQLRMTMLALAPAIMIGMSGCGEETLPDSKGSSREMLENPVAARAKLESAEAEAKATKSQSRLSTKAKANQEAIQAKAKNADPRGH